MAEDNLKFEIVFDIEEGVKKAIKDGDKLLDRIEKALGRRPINIRVQLNSKGTRGRASEIVGFRKQLAELTQQWNTLTAAERGSAAGAAIREKFRALRWRHKVIPQRSKLL